jgi:hypothetical protein
MRNKRAKNLRNIGIAKIGHLAWLSAIVSRFLMGRNCSRGNSTEVLIGYPGGQRPLPFEIFTPKSDLEAQNAPRARVGGYSYSKIEAVYLMDFDFDEATKTPLICSLGRWDMIDAKKRPYIQVFISLWA